MGIALGAGSARALTLYDDEPPVSCESPAFDEGIEEPMGARASSLASSSAAAAPPTEPVVRREGEAAPSKGLHGYIITTEAAHGRIYYGNQWIWQRPDFMAETLGIVHRRSSREDLNARRMVHRWLEPYLENAGATVYSDRCRDEQINEVIVDFDAAPGAPHETTGSWSDATGDNARGGRFTLAETVAGAQPTATALIRATIPESGYYGVTIWYPTDYSASTAARFTVIDAAGFRHTFLVDQTRDTGRWTRLERFYFEAGTNIPILEVSNNTGEPDRRVGLDAVRLGGGMGSISFGGGVSGLPRYQETSKAWLAYLGAPDWVWSVPTDQHDYGVRFNYISWQIPDLFLRIHTNAAGTPGNGTGTARFFYGRTEDERVRLDGIFNRMVAVIRANFDSAWRTNSYSTTGITTRPAPYILLEVAFHDREVPDTRYMMDADFRRWAMRGAYEGALNFLTNSTGVFSPEPPEAPYVRRIAPGRVQVGWQTPPSGGGAPAAYRIYSSRHPFCFKDYVEVAAPAASAEIDGLEPNALYYFQLRAKNDGGISFPTETLAARTSSAAEPVSTLVVSGFTRFDWDVDEMDNRRVFAVHHARAIAEAAANLGIDVTIDSAAARAVTGAAGGVSPAIYDMVDWSTGDNGPADDTLSPAQQTLLSAYAQGDGTVLVSGSNVAFDINQGDLPERVFLASVLRAACSRDDAGADALRGVNGTRFAGIEATLDAGAGDAYDVFTPDVIAPAGTTSTTCFTYGDGAEAAGVYFLLNRRALFFFGFPFEAVQGPAQRTAIMEKVLATTLPPEIRGMGWMQY